MQSRFLIGAASSGSGKTTLTLGLLRAFVRRGLAVQPFKCGPDYIDPQFHRLAASHETEREAGTGTEYGTKHGRESINLDLWMASEEHLSTLFARHSAGADVCVAEGVMGLFDGYRAGQGSSAEVARLLNLPVVLVVDARSTAYSVAPLLYGYKNFRPEVEIAGVIFNRVASPSHYEFLREAAHDAGVETLGYLPCCEDFVAPSRHLGLSLENLEAFSPTIDAIADALEEHVDLDRLLELTRRPVPSPRPVASKINHYPSTIKKIAVAQDEAFNFLYRANLDRLEELGYEIAFFSPLHDPAPPADADLIYLPGGYPEFHATALAANLSMREAIRDYAESGGRILAECGGMLYLCRSLTPVAGAAPVPMCGVLPLDGTMEGARLHLGYRELHLPNGLHLRGHEFHYSQIQGEMPSVAQQFSARGKEVQTPLYRYKNTLAGYTHLYWAESDPMQLFENQIISIR
jgi:cobyrinic acid a,c-diamide synthase